MTRRTIKLTIAYDGTGYHGWQVQPGLPTIEGTVTEALGRLTGQQIEITGSSRTDAGVHALAQVAHFHIESPIPTENFAPALSRLLPDDITIVDACEVPNTFNAISDTKSKIYRYTIHTGPTKPVLDIRYCWHRPGELDIPAMQNAAKRLEGTHDFKSLASAADQRTSSVRTILHCSLFKQEDFIYFTVQADGFLYNMVRNIVGTLVEIGRGRWEPEYMDTILAAKDRNAAGPIAPASGLNLIKILYQ